MKSYFLKHKSLCFVLLVYFILLVLTLNSTIPYKGDESYYLVSALNMVKNGNYFVPYYYNQPRFQKPILPYWVTILGYKLFGIHLWSGRFFFLIFAILLLILIYKFSLLILDDRKFAFLNVILLSSSTMFILFSRAAMTDLLLTFFSVLSLYYFYNSLIQPSKLKRYYLYAYISMGFAFLSKGWAGIFPVIAWLIYLVLIKPENYIKYIYNLFHPLYIIIFCAIAFSWYLYIFLSPYKKIFLSQLKVESTGKLSINFKLILKKFVYYTGVLIRYYFPFTLIGAYLYIKQKVKFPPLVKFLLIYFFVIFLSYTFLIGMYRSRYLFPVFPAITLITGFIFYKSNLIKIMKRIAIVIFTLQVVALLTVPIIRNEPVKEIAEYVRSKKYKDFSAYNIDTRNLGWLLIFTGGEVRKFTGKNRYVLIKEDDYNKFSRDYTIEKEAVKLKKIKFENKRIKKIFKKFLLLRKVK